MEGKDEEFGRIDVVVSGYPRGVPMTGEAIPKFLDLVDRGIIRVLDARFARKDADGTFSGFDLADLDQDSAGDLKVFAGQPQVCQMTMTSRSPRRKSSLGMRR